MDKNCLVCNNMYYAKRSTSKFCSAVCRVKYSRTDTEQQPGTTQEAKKPMTQAEIESYYTLKNFPPVKYYSLNGGGNGSYSPYPMSDPRSKAYSLI